MSGLVGYGSSDEEEDIQPERPAKIAKLDPVTSQRTDEISNVQARKADDRQRNVPGNVKNEASAILEAQSTALPAGTATGPAAIPIDEAPPTAGPSDPEDPDHPPLSPYTFERQRLRELTMPPVANFDIPSSPPPPPTNSEEAAALAARTKKFKRFLELKKQGVHFNDRLRGSASLRNPSLLPKLMEFAGITTEDSYASTLPEGLGVPVRWPEEVYVEGLIKMNERKEKSKKAERDKVDFVPATSRSAATSAKSTPGTGSGEHRKSRFDRQ